MKKYARSRQSNEKIYMNIINDMTIYLLSEIGLTPGGSSTVHIYTKTIHRTTQRKQNIQNIHSNKNT
jgi:uncharacterized integral membrane protein